MKKFLKNKLAVFGSAILLIIVLIALFAPLIAPYSPYEIIGDSLENPSAAHIFGTDDIGRDILSRVIYGSRISLTVGIVAVSIAVIIGTIFGSTAGYFGGLWDSLLMRFVDSMLAFPTIFLILTIQAVLSPNIYNVMLVIGLTSWMGVTRLVRGEFLTIRERSYVEAARAIGCSNTRIIFRHILPNASAPILVAATLGVAGAILTESALSFLGLGVQPPLASWGNMLMDALLYLRYAPWMALIPGFFIFITVLSIYFVGEGLREMLNPR